MSNYVEMARTVMATRVGTTECDSPATIETVPAAGPAPYSRVSQNAQNKAPDAPAPSLKGQAVELWCDQAGGRVFIVADEQDAQEVLRRLGARRGQVWTPGEIELVASIEDQAVREEVAGLKRTLNGVFRQGTRRDGEQI
jgi:hypothetical protein